MQNEKKQTPQSDYEKVVSMLTPKHPRMPAKLKLRHKYARIWTIGSIAAMLTIVCTVALKSVSTANASTIPASEIVMDALNSGLKSENFKIDFKLRGKQSDEDVIYAPSPEGQMVNGTLYILYKDGKAMNRLDWHDTDKNSIIFDGTTYVHTKNGAEIRRHPSKDDFELGNLMNLKSLGQITDNEISEEKDLIVVNHRKKNSPIVFNGVFSRKDKRLVKASVIYKMSGGQPVMLMETTSIEFDANVPVNLFDIIKSSVLLEN